jgi:SecD/SecF fusion protein
MTMGFLRGIYSFDYTGHKKWWFALSGTILVIGLISLFVRGGGNPVQGLSYGLEFKTGTRITVAFEQPVALADVRSEVSGAGYPNAQIQQVSQVAGTENAGFLIAVEELMPDEQAMLKDQLDAAFTIVEVEGSELWSQQTVGPTFGRLVVEKSLEAAAVALVLIMAYIWFRFASWKFAVGAIAAEFHDVLIVIGVYSLTGREVTTATIAAVLTIIGYSLYDTVIIYDRIRENTPKLSRLPYGQMVNHSLWQSITRSINTTLTTLLPVTALLLFGGTTLTDFAFALFVGILAGAYSSIFVAAPIVTVLKEREPQYRRLAARVAEET